jgi:hypothetical protein
VFALQSKPTIQNRAVAAADATRLRYIHCHHWREWLFVLHANHTVTRMLTRHRARRCHT